MSLPPLPPTWAFLFLRYRYETDGEKGRTGPVGDYLKAATTKKFP